MRKISILLVALSCGVTSPYAPVYKDIAGIWQMKSLRSFLPSAFLGAKPQKQPKKEFTVHPKDPNADDSMELEILLMLNNDGSFVQYGRMEEKEKENKGLKGTWDFLNGKLILAKDRQSDSNARHVHDTIMTGNVCASSKKNIERETSLNSTKESSPDVGLAVPKGSVEIGKFTYPKDHPEFFAQPIFKPTPTGSFELRQILSENAMIPKHVPVEKFKREDFHGRRFLLTSTPLKFKPKKKLRWSRMVGGYVEDAKDEKDDLEVRVMEIQFFANNTFSTIASSESVKILRGRFNVIGDSKDYLWFQVTRFGFGRSNFGSVHSEGIGLSQDDSRAYWGKICQEDNESSSLKDESKRIQVNGSVLIGWGLEPFPVDKFIMKEIDVTLEDYRVDEDFDLDDTNIFQ